MRHTHVRVGLVLAIVSLASGCLVGDEAEEGDDAVLDEIEAGGRKPACCSTIELVLVDSTDGLPHYGQLVTFDVATTVTTMPWVHLQCYQNGALVGERWQGFFPNALGSEDFVLGGSPAWQSGAAECTAWLEQYVPKGNHHWQQLTSTTFHVYE